MSHGSTCSWPKPGELQVLRWIILSPLLSYGTGNIRLWCLTEVGECLEELRKQGKPVENTLNQIDTNHGERYEKKNWGLE